MRGHFTGASIACSHDANIPLESVFASCEYLNVHVITQTRLIEFWKKHPDAEPPLRAWLTLTRNAKWKNFVDVKATFNSADYKDPSVIFDIGGNKFRIIAKVEYWCQKVFISHVFTHAEYDKWNKS